jgi:hypothetical protein
MTDEVPSVLAHNYDQNLARQQRLSVGIDGGVHEDWMGVCQ